MSVQMLKVKKGMGQNSFGALQRSMRMENLPKKVGIGVNATNIAIEQVFISHFTQIIWAKGKIS